MTYKLLCQLLIPDLSNIVTEFTVGDKQHWRNEFENTLNIVERLGFCPIFITKVKQKLLWTDRQYDISSCDDDYYDRAIISENEIIENAMQEIDEKNINFK